MEQRLVTLPPPAFLLSIPTTSHGSQTSLGSATASTSSQGFTLTISGLTMGTQYHCQWWCNDSSSEFGFSTTATAGDDVRLTSHTYGAEGGLGQFAIGTFVADSHTRVISYSISEIGFLNAFQLRELPAGSVPEGGATLGFLALGLAGLAFLRRRFAIALD
ncbi:MAG: VPDSG-CTERM sorting domain-containing protein [Chthoniobacterales bacterium]